MGFNWVVSPIKKRKTIKDQRKPPTIEERIVLNEHLNNEYLPFLELLDAFFHSRDFTYLF
jgi:hypothetical protein